MNVLKLIFRLGIELPFLELSFQVSLEDSVHDTEWCFLDQSIVFRVGNVSLLAWLISECFFFKPSSLLDLRVIGCYSASSVWWILQWFSILVNHKEGSEHVQFVVLSDIVEHLLNLDDDSSVEGNTISVHVVLKSPEWLLNVNLGVKWKDGSSSLEPWVDSFLFSISLNVFDAWF